MPRRVLRILKIIDAAARADAQHMWALHHRLHHVVVPQRRRRAVVHQHAAERFAQWLTSTAGQEAIAAFRADGTQVFFPNAK